MKTCYFACSSYKKDSEAWEIEIYTNKETKKKMSTESSK